MRKHGRLCAILLAGLTTASCAGVPNARQKSVAHAPNEYQRLLTAVDRTLRNQIQAFSIPVVVALTPTSIAMSVTPTITYRPPGEAAPSAPPITGIAK